jgi:hypothetical protein
MALSFVSGATQDIQDQVMQLRFVPKRHQHGSLQDICNAAMLDRILGIERNHGVCVRCD